MGTHIWGYWDCPYCGTKGIRGDNKKCPHCGIQIPPDTKYYVKEGVREVVEKSKLDDDAHWICEYCDTQNQAWANYCFNCGSPRSDAKRDYFGNRLNGNTPQQPLPPVAGETGTNAAAAPKSPFKKLIKLLIIPLIAVLLIWIFLPVTRTATVTGFEWERTIAIEEFTNVSENGWSLPQNAHLHETRQEIKSYRQELDHYETRTRKVSKQVQDGYDVSYRDLGNGQFEEIRTPRYRTEYETETYKEPVYRSVPVYATKYYYDVDKWVKAGSAVSSGADKSPYWRDTGLKTNVSSPAYGDRREGGRTEKYYAVIAAKNGKEYRTERNFTEWQALSEGDKIKYRTSRFSDKPLDDF